MEFIRVLTILLFTFCLSACNNRVGVESVEIYAPVGKANVYNRHENAQGFYDIIRAHSDWDGEFHQKDAAAWEKHFKRDSLGGIDTNWIDKVDFAYFSGHGAGAGTVPTGVGRGGGFTFGVDANDDWVLSSIPSSQEPRWGDYNLEWIVLDVCSALAKHNDGSDVTYTLTQRWANSDVMHGLHYILGFRTAATDSGTRGRIFAEHLTGAYDGTIYKIRTAWRKATEITEGPLYEGAYLRAASAGSDTSIDHLHEYGTVSNDPKPSSQYFGYLSWPTL